MTDGLARAQLARAARRLNRSSRPDLPALALLTDDERLPDPELAFRLLPRRSLVILRARTSARRVELASSLAVIAREHELTWIVADDAMLAARMGAAGAHFPERAIALAAHWRARRPRWLLTCAAHSLRACAHAARFGANAVLLGPIFATQSHPARAALGQLRARAIANLAPIPVYALGGVDAGSARQLAGAHLAGLAAIGALAGSGKS